MTVSVPCKQFLLVFVVLLVVPWVFDSGVVIERVAGFVGFVGFVVWVGLR
jgi:hypothetical protein